LQDADNYPVIANDKHYERLANWIDEAVGKGAKIVRGNTKVKEKRFISPTVLVDVPNDTKLMEEEIFGPIIPVVSYSNLNDVVNQINSKDKALTLSIFSKNDDSIKHVLNNTSSGGSCVNDVILSFFTPFLPFGGVNNSGTGKAHGFYGFKAFSNEKSVLHTQV